MKKFIWTIVLSSLSLGFIQYLIAGVYSAVFLIVIFAFYFFVAYLIFALPLQYLLNKNPKRFSFVYFLYYLLLSLVANFLIFYSQSTPSYPPLITRPKIYFYSLVAAIGYWFWDSVFSQKKRL